MDDHPAPRYLSATRGNQYPTSLVGVTCEGEYTVTPGLHTYRTERLVRWCAAGWTAKCGVIGKEWSGCGQDQESFWAAARFQARRAGETWIVAYGASRVCALLGLWERLESGEVYLSGEQHQPVINHPAGNLPPTAATQGTVTVQRQGAAGGLAGAGGADRAAWPARGRQWPRAVPYAGPGCAILEDPPTIIRARLVGVPGSLLVVDLRNYGINLDAQEGTCAALGATIASIMARMVAFLRDHSYGSLRVTVGSQALYTFRRAYLRAPVLIHRDPAALAIEKAALFGGRCECRQIGQVKGPLYHVDFRSLYPSICASLPLPTLLRGTGTGTTGDVCHERGSESLCVADVALRTDEPAYPYRADGRVIYPVGTFRTVLCGPELSDALERGRVKEVYRTVRYTGTWALRDYAQELYAHLATVRQSGDKPIEQWLKALLVCLPGKMGQHGGRWESAPRSKWVAPWAEWYSPNSEGTLERYRSIGEEVYCERGDEWSRDSCPAVASWVCSAGRRALLAVLRCAGWSRVYYHDTDSLIVSEEGYRRIEEAGWVAPDVLGKLRNLGVFQSAEFRGLRDYELDGKRQCAGCPKGESRPGPDSGSFWFRCPLTRDVVRGHAPRAQEVLRGYVRAGMYKHGHVRPDGQVDPIRVDEQP